MAPSWPAALFTSYIFGIVFRLKYQYQYVVRLALAAVREKFIEYSIQLIQDKKLSENEYIKVYFEEFFVFT
jgi:hypothetical protein